jgi:hypothetical protein
LIFFVILKLSAVGGERGVSVTIATAQAVLDGKKEEALFMTTKVVRKNGKLTDEQFGAFMARAIGIAKKAGEWGLGYEWAMAQQQKTFEGIGEFDSLSIRILTKLIEDVDVEPDRAVCHLEDKGFEFGLDWEDLIGTRHGMYGLGGCAKYQLVLAEAGHLTGRNFAPFSAVLKAIVRLGGHECTFSDTMHLGGSGFVATCPTDTVFLFGMEPIQANRNDEMGILRVAYRWSLRPRISLFVAGPNYCLEANRWILFRLPEGHPLLNK